MEINPLLACSSANSWYHFAYPFSWSNNCEVSQLLSDIPFISMGILVFGVSPLFLALHRISLSTVWLLSSVLLAFIAVVLDLGQTLADGLVVNMASEPGLRTREVLLALSIGFRFLFYWSYVADPPRKFLSAHSTPRNKFLAFESSRESHSGSWIRWGLPGKLLGVGLLAAIVTITALQIVWRVDPRFHQYSNTYASDTALELLVSFLLLLKLLLNTLALNLPDNTPVYAFRECLAPIFGLLVNIVIGVGNLLSFAFTESIIGRLLQALEIYIVVVFVTIIAFLRHRDVLLSTTSSQGKQGKDMVFTLPEPVRGSTFRITTPVIETPRMSMILGSTSPNKQPARDVFPRSVRRSLNHVSSWLSSRVSRNRLRYEDDEAKLWNVERMKVDPPYTGDIDTELRASIVSLTQEPKEWTDFAPDASASRISIISALDAQSAGARSMEEAFQGVQTLYPAWTNTSRPINPLQARASSVQVSSTPLTISRTKHTGSIAVTSEASPVYGFCGSQSLASVSESRMSLDELLRQQSQLDQSIEALKLFSARSTSSNSITNPNNVELTRSSSIGQRTVSSDVSLSSFPIPPWLTSPVPSLPSSHSTPIGRVRGGRRVHSVAARSTLIQDKEALVPPKTPAALVDIPSSPRFDSIPNSPLEEESEPVVTEVRKPSSDPGGMQYNVTSFIGGLATTEESAQSDREKPWWSTENDSNVWSNRTGPGVEKLPPRTLPAPPRPEGLPAYPALAKRSPFTPRSSRSRPQLMRETGSRMTEEAYQGVSERVFVRPRPLPLTIQSHGDRDPGVLQVQVVVDE